MTFDTERRKGINMKIVHQWIKNIIVTTCPYA